MNGWNEATLADLVVEQNGIKTGPFGTILSAAEYTSVGVPVISVGEIGYGNFRLRKETPRVGENITSRLHEYLLREGDIVFGRKGAVDRSAWVSAAEAGWFLGSDGLRARVKPGVNSRFVAFQLRSQKSRDWLLRHAVGSTLLSLNQGTLGSIPLRVPPLAEQQAIAEVLGALDDKIAANTKLAAIAEAFSATMLRARVSQVARLKDLVTLKKTTVNPTVLVTDVVDHYSLPAFDNSQMPVIESPAQIRSNKFSIDGDVVLLSKLNPRFPRVWRARRENHWPSLASTEFLVLSPSKVSRDLLWATLAQPSFSSALDAKVAGTSGSHQRVKPDDALETLVLDPRELDEAPAAVIGAVLQRASKLRNENRTLAATRDALLPQLMSGRIRVRDAEKLASEAGA